MIISKEKKDGVTIYYLDKNISDERMEKLKNTYVKSSQISIIINNDADIYNADGSKLLIRFRKNKLSDKKINDFYDNVIKFAMGKTSNRGSASGSTKKNVRENPNIMTNILGYVDRFSVSQHRLFRLKKSKKLLNVRETRFSMIYPDKFKKLIPLIQEINLFYKKYIPKCYEKQITKANQTPFKIPGTAFTTITTNENFRTSIHRDKGDDADGFGNLAVIENGKYDGGETCLPQYGVGVNVRTGDILFINVHEWHGNLPIKLEDSTTKRLSIVCYLRTNLWKKTKHMTKKNMIEHNNMVKSVLYND
jgi:hypothetical protein